MNVSRLNIVTALACEARILLDAYRLVRVDNSSSFQIFVNAEKTIYLIISGIGKLQAAIATSYLYAYSGAHTHTCFLNIGIAGGGQQTVGQLFLAHKIIDAATQQQFYPRPVLSQSLANLAVLTVDCPCIQYPENMLVDMEAAGYYRAAISFVNQEQVQTVKIVSDNHANPAQRILPQQVIELMQAQWPAIQRVVDYQQQLSAMEAAQQPLTIHFSSLRDRWHFTAYQQYQLCELLRRWQLFFSTIDPLEFCVDALNASEVLIKLTDYLNQTDIYADRLL